MRVLSPWTGCDSKGDARGESNKIKDKERERRALLS